MAHRPNITGRDSRYPIQFDIAHTSGIGAGDDAPLAAVPVFDQALADIERLAAGSARETRRPEIMCGNERDRIERIAVGANTHSRAGNNFPATRNNCGLTWSWGVIWKWG